MQRRPRPTTMRPLPAMTGPAMSRDTLYANEKAASGSFEFNDAVAGVFPDMLRRSIPGYAQTIEAISGLARRVVQPGSTCYDLGCSLGAATLAMRRIASGMRSEGVLVLSEKVTHDDPKFDALLSDLHHDFKRQNAYSDLEIARKRAAIENVLIPDTVATHLARLQNAGFRYAGVWLRWFNFVSFVAVR